MLEILVEQHPINRPKNGSSLRTLPQPYPQSEPRQVGNVVMHIVIAYAHPHRKPKGIAFVLIVISQMLAPMA